MPVRAGAWQDENSAWAYFPMVSLRSILMIGRDEGPAFLRSEISHAERVLDLAMKTLERVLGRPPSLEDASELTAAVPLHEPA
jgi:hypothetical protein